MTNDELEARLGDFYITATNSITQVQLQIGNRNIHIVATIRGKVEVKTSTPGKVNSTVEHLKINIPEWYEREALDDGSGDRAYEVAKGK